MQSTTTTATSSPSTSAAATRLDERKMLRRIISDVIVFIVLVITILVCEFGIEPYRRGFFCDDETIRYPMQPNTVTTVMLGLLVGLMTLVIIVVVEFVRFQQRGELNRTRTLFAWHAPIWLIECGKQIVFYLYGSLVTLNATELAKYTIGRLRPHFIAVCQPLLLNGTCSDPWNQHRYIEDYICVAHGYTLQDVRQARLSFPSGHSSLAFYAMLYMTVYLQRKMTYRGSHLLRHSLQFSLIMIAWFTALSRIIDNWHHWSDVLAGVVIGVLGALLTIHYVAKLSDVVPIGELKATIQRHDTSTSLQDVIAIPPPYSLRTADSFSNNEDYCTKV